MKQDSNNIISWPKSARHMSRNQATDVIRNIIVNHCHCLRIDGASKDDVKTLIDDAKALGYDISYQMYDDGPEGEPFIYRIGYIVLRDHEVKDHMRFNGASYWGIGFEQCHKSECVYGVDVAPSKTEGAITISTLIASQRNYASYFILCDDGSGKHKIEPGLVKENVAIINELDKTHSLVENLVDGYMYAQGREQWYKKHYLHCPNYASAFLALAVNAIIY